MSKLQALREKQGECAKAIRQLNDKMNAEGYTATAEDSENWAKVNASYDAAKAARDREEISARAEGEAASRNDRISPFIADDRRSRGDGAGMANDDATRTMALAAWCRAQCRKPLTEDHFAACRATGIDPAAGGELVLSMYGTADLQRAQSAYRRSAINPFNHADAMDRLSDFKALGTGSGPSGGYLIAPEQMRTTLEINMLAFGGVRQVAETIRTASGEPLSWPTADDTTNTGVQLGESTTIGSTGTDPTFSKVLWSAYKFSSKPMFVPYELLQDSVFNLPALIGQYFGERLGRITNTKYTTGTGASTPKGIVTCATSFAAASASAITFDDILGLEHAIDPSYRGGGAYMAHDSIMLAIRRMKDGVGHPIWQSNWQSGTPDRLNGYPIVLNQDMDSTISSGKKSLLFGQLSKYKIRSVGDIRMYHLVERYRDTDQDGFVAFIREDGNLLTAGTPPVKYLSH